MSLTRQFLLDLTAPPALACLWWLGSRGWGFAVQGGQVSNQTKNRQKVGFFVVLTALYLVMFGTTFIFASLNRSHEPQAERILSTRSPT
jgi:hypothetical protein